MKGLLLTHVVENLPVLHLPSCYGSSQSLLQVPREGALIGSALPMCPVLIHSAVARGARLHKHGCRVLPLSVKRSSVSWTDTHEVSTKLLDELRLEVNICLGKFVSAVLGFLVPLHPYCISFCPEALKGICSRILPAKGQAAGGFHLRSTFRNRRAQRSN